MTETIDPVASLDARMGVAHVSGTIACTGDVAFLDVSGTLRQRAGRVVVQGPIFVEVPAAACDGSPVPWTSSVTAPLGLFKGGKASAMVSASADPRLLGANGGHRLGDPRSDAVGSAATPGPGVPGHSSGSVMPDVSGCLLVAVRRELDLDPDLEDVAVPSTQLRSRRWEG